MTRLLCSIVVVAIAAWAPSATAGKAKKKGTELTLKLDGVDKTTKAALIKKLEKTVKKVKGVLHAKVHKAKSHMVVRHNDKATLEAIHAAIAKAGFKLAKTPADLPEPEPEDEEETEQDPLDG